MTPDGPREVQRAIDALRHVDRTLQTAGEELGMLRSSLHGARDEHDDRVAELVAELRGIRRQVTQLMVDIAGPDCGALSAIVAGQHWREKSGTAIIEITGYSPNLSNRWAVKYLHTVVLSTLTPAEIREGYDLMPTEP